MEAIGATTSHFGARAGRAILPAVRRGLFGTCPACGRGRLFHRYLKVVDTCEGCQEALHHQRADDAPPYFTMLIVGHIVVPLALLLERIASPETWQHLAIWLPTTLALTLFLLPRIKGALVGLQWALGMHGFSNEPDSTDGRL
jgi:uncharacterized protein (DUF983 family)